MAVFVGLFAALVGVLFLVARRLHQSRERMGCLESRLASVLGRSASGLSVWSSDGRLVACNDRFREFYPEIPIRPGVELEDLLRCTVTRGLVQVPEAEVDDWVRAHLGGTRAPRRAVVRTADGRWLALDIGPTDRGEILMLFTDVSDRHDAEAGVSELTGQVRARTAEVDLLLQVIEHVGRADSFESAARSLVRLVCGWASWQVGHVYKVDPDTRRVTPMRTTLRVTDEALASLQTALANEAPSLADGLVGRVVQTGRVIWVPHLESDPTFSGERRAIMTGIRGACGVPVTHGARVVGVLEFLSAEPLVPSPSRTALLEAFGEVLGSVSDRSVAP